MKKTYIIPSTQLHQVELQSMIASSPTLEFKNGSGRGTLQNTDASDDAMSRGGSLWDDED